MEKATAIFLSVVVLLIVFVLGAGAGVFYQTQQNVSQSNTNQIMPPVISQLHSKVIRAVSASGKVTSIFGKTIALTNAGENLTIKVNDNAQIYSYVPASTSKNGTTIPAGQKKLAFSDIKIGDNLSLDLRILPDNTLECTSIFIVNVPIINTTGAK
jgi:hypothetical protein